MMDGSAQTPERRVLKKDYRNVLPVAAGISQETTRAKVENGIKSLSQAEATWFHIYIHKKVIQL